jgi:hypothetical protein
MRPGPGEDSSDERHRYYEASGKLHDRFELALRALGHQLDAFRDQAAIDLQGRWLITPTASAEG